VSRPVDRSSQQRLTRTRKAPRYVRRDIQVSLQSHKSRRIDSGYRVEAGEGAWGWWSKSIPAVQKIQSIPPPNAAQIGSNMAGVINSEWWIEPRDQVITAKLVVL
jgi:hypothetical protein